MSIGLAMWSGPRNISTAMMRSWENRPDCEVVDEPFYACYLRETGLPHPCREAILTSQSSNREAVISQLLHPARPAALFYQKQMTHHIPRGMNMEWCAQMLHCFLIRDPAQVIASYLNKMPDVDEEAIGIVRQAELFDEISDITGRRPAVIDSADVLRSPQQVLHRLCDTLDLEFPAQAMMSWPAGPRESDGVWASHWYQSVEQSTGFGPYHAAEPELSGEHQALAEAMQGHYQHLAQYRLQAL